MISSIKGKVSFSSADYLIVETGGIGYKIFVTPDTLLKKKGDEVSLWCHLAVRENAMDLYGFEAKEEMDFFELLLGISGIGPKSALSIISLAPVSTIKKAVSSGESTYLTKVSGIGAKTAQKIMIELKDKLGEVDLGEGDLKEDADAIEALRSLGYTLQESRDALKKVSKETSGADQKVKAALKQLGE